MVVPDEHGQLGVPRFDAIVLPDDYHDFIGCHFVAANYQLDRYHDPVFRPKASLWHLFQVALFDPIYPILIRDERPRAIKANEKSALGGIVVAGNATRLEQDKKENIDYDNTHVIQLDGDGTAMLRYFVIKGSDDPKADWERMANYIPKEVGVTITLNGQRQGIWRRDAFDRLGLISIGKMLIAQADCDGLTKKAKRELFSTTRDRIKDSPIAMRLENAVRAAIGSDSRLRELDRERKVRALARQSEAEAKKIHDWLKEAINSAKQGVQPIYRKVISTNTEYQLLGDQPLLDETTSGPDGAPPEDTLLTDPPAEPTTLRVLNPTVRVPVGEKGGTGVVRLAIDAADDFISPEPGVSRGQFAAKFTKGEDLFQLTGYSAVRRGVIRATIAVKRGVPVGENGRVIFVVAKPDGSPLLAEADIVTVEAPQARAKPAGTKAGPEPGPKVEAVDRQGWREFGWPEDVVARVEEDPTTGITTIYVFKEYPKLMNRLQRERIVEEELLVHHQSKFVAAMALAAWLQHDDERKAESRHDREDLDAELRRAAELFLFSQQVAKD